MKRHQMKKCLKRPAKQAPRPTHGAKRAPFGPLNQCPHRMVQCHMDCGHWFCELGCGLTWDDHAEC